MEYRFISHSFPNERVHDSWKTRIDVKIEKTSTGSVFYVQPKAGFGIWFFSAMTIIALLSGLVQLDFTYKVNGIILSFVLLTIIIYFIERFNVRRLIDRFKKEAL